jgi:hypothetical protein
MTGTAKQVLGHIMSRTTGPESVRSLMRLVGIRMKLAIGSEARRKNPGSGFWNDIADSANWEFSSGSDIIAGASHYAAGFKHRGGTVSAPGRGPGSRFSSWLTIPISNEAKGKNASDFPRKKTFIARSKAGNLIIFRKPPKVSKKSRKRAGRAALSMINAMAPKPLFVLKKSVTVRPNPWFPEDDASVAEVIRSAGRDWMKKGGTA